MAGHQHTDEARVSARKLTYADFLKHIRGAPALVVETLSKGTRKVDETIKRDLYDRVGVREYWTVDPAGQRITVYARSGDPLERRPELSAERRDTLTTTLLPGFALSLADYFLP